MTVRHVTQGGRAPAVQTKVSARRVPTVHRGRDDVASLTEKLTKVVFSGQMIVSIMLSGIHWQIGFSFNVLDWLTSSSSAAQTPDMPTLSPQPQGQPMRVDYTQFGAQIGFNDSFLTGFDS